MLYYDRIDVSEGIDDNKTSGSKECDICHYWYFLDYSFKFQPNVYNSCHDLLMMSINLTDTAILNIKGFDYCCIISLISKNEAIKLLRNADLTEKSGKLWIKKMQNFLKAYIKMEKVLKFNDIENLKQTFHQHKERISVSKKVYFSKKGFKYFISYKNAKKLNFYVYFSIK